jgi:MYXO-CTERM domain-containing protein
MIRLDLVDPMNREWSAYSRAYIAVVDDVGEESCDGGNFVSNPCDTETDTGTSGAATESGGEMSGGSESGPQVTDGGGGEGCSCSSGEPRSVWMLGAFGLLMFGWVRRMR